MAFVRSQNMGGKTVLSCSMSEAQVGSVNPFGSLMVLHSMATGIELPGS
jgi:hypothetical protein